MFKSKSFSSLFVISSLYMFQGLPGLAQMPMPTASPSPMPTATPMPMPTASPSPMPTYAPARPPDAFASPTSTTTTSVCGNTIMETEEQCDDGNITDGDGCSCTCQIESMSSGTPASPPMP